MKSWSRTTIVVVLVAAISAACGLVKSPEVELTGLRVRSVGFRGATLLGSLRIENPNKFAIEADSVTFLLESRDPEKPNQWSHVASGSDTERLRVEKEGVSTVEIPIDFAYSDLRTPIRSIIDRGTMDYRIRGRVFVRRPLPKSLPFNREGTVSIGGR